MNLREYVNEVKASSANTLGSLVTSDHTVVCELSDKSGIGKTTLYKILNGHRLNRYNLAVALSRATGGRVKIGDLLKEG